MWAGQWRKKKKTLTYKNFNCLAGRAHQKYPGETLCGSPSDRQTDRQKMEDLFVQCLCSGETSADTLHHPCSAAQQSCRTYSTASPPNTSLLHMTQEGPASASHASFPNPLTLLNVHLEKEKPTPTVGEIFYFLIYSKIPTDHLPSLSLDRRFSYTSCVSVTSKRCVEKIMENLSRWLVLFGDWGLFPSSCKLEKMSR